jgi:MFS family permease
MKTTDIRQNIGQSLDYRETDQLTIIRSIRSFPAPVWIVLAGMFLNRFGTFVIPFLGLHLRKAGYPEAHAGWALALYGAGHVSSAIIGGYLADSLGKRRSIVLSMVMGAGAIGTLSSVGHIVLICICAFMAGLTSELYRPSASALLSESVPNKDRITAFAMLRFCINLGWSLGPAMGGWLASHSFVMLFRLDALTCLAFGGLAFFGLRKKERRHVKWDGVGKIPGHLVHQFKITLKNRLFRRLMLSNTLIAFVFIQWISTLGISMENAGLSSSQYGLVLGLNGILIVLFEIPLTAWTRRYSPLKMIGLGNAMIAISVLFIAFNPTMPNYFLGMMVFTFGEMISLPVGMAYVSKLAPDHQRGRFMGMNGISWSTAFMLGPSMGMVLCPIFPSGFWIACACLGAVAVIIMKPLDQQNRN